MIVRLSHKHSTGKPAKKTTYSLNGGITSSQFWVNIPYKIAILLNTGYMEGAYNDSPPHPEGTILVLTQE